MKPKGPYRLIVYRDTTLGMKVSWTNVQYQRLEIARSGARRLLHEHDVQEISLKDAEQRTIYQYWKTPRGGYQTMKHHECRVTGGDA